MVRAPRFTKHRPVADRTRRHHGRDGGADDGRGEEGVRGSGGTSHRTLLSGVWCAEYGSGAAVRFPNSTHHKVDIPIDC